MRERVQKFDFLRATRAPAQLSVAGMGWPRQVGELLPRAEEAIGVRYKLATYSLVKGHKSGGAKAFGFERILGITLESIDYLERAIILGAQETPIVSVRENWPFGLMCVVDCRVRGLVGFAKLSSPL